MVIDASKREIAEGNLAGQCLDRADIIGGPLAREVFAVCDAVLVQDTRLAGLQ